MTPATMTTALDLLHVHAEQLADAEHDRAVNEMAKCEREAEIVASLIGNPNPMTNKPHSASSAAEAASNDPAIVAFRQQRLVHERAVTMARATYEATRIRAWYFANSAAVDRG